MANAGYRWMMTAPKALMIREPFEPSPSAGETVVEVAGCGVCHTDLGYFYDGVRTNHAPPPMNVDSFVEPHPVADINQVFEAVHHREIERRAVLIP